MTIPDILSTVSALTAIGLILLLSARLKQHLKQVYL